MEEQPIDIAMDHHQAGRLAEAEALYRAILAAEPDNGDALQMLGVLAHQCGHTDTGIDLILRALAIIPNQPFYLNNLGTLLRDRGDTDEAARLWTAAAELAPDYLDPHLNLARLAQAEGDFNRAAEHFRATVRLAPESGALWFGFACCLERVGNTAEAEQAYGQALVADPDMIPALRGLGDLLRGQGRFDEARRCYERLCGLEPDRAELWTNLGSIHQVSGNNLAARQATERALSLDPTIAAAWNNLGNTFLAEDRHAEALDRFQRASALDPTYATARYNSAIALKEMGRLEEAEAIYRDVIALKPDMAEAHWNLSQALLHLGRYEEGWREFEWRWGVVGGEPRIDAPRWDGSPMPEGTLLLVAEQGLGDCINYARFIPQVAAMAKKVVMQLHSPLHRLLRGIPGLDRMVGLDESPGPVTAGIPLMSLTGLLGTTFDAIPAPISYLSADPGLVEAWRERLRPHPGPRVGLVWSGNPEQGRNRLRSIGFAPLAPILDLPGISFLSLQKGGPAAELNDRRVVSLADHLTDMAETAAAITQLDMVITVDTSIAHLAGALGKPVWVLLCHVPDWRYLRHGSTTPWYPTMRLFRQPEFGRWDLAVAELRDALARWRS